MRLDDGQIEVIDDAHAQVLRAKSGAERLRIAHGMWVLTRDRLRAYLRERYPNLDSDTLNREVARRLLARGPG